MNCEYCIKKIHAHLNHIYFVGVDENYEKSVLVFIN